jgi:outer membrane protein assembly factor BamB
MSQANRLSNVVSDLEWEVRWQYDVTDPYDIQSGSPVTPLVSEGYVFYPTSQGMMALEFENGTVVWPTAGQTPVGNGLTFSFMDLYGGNLIAAFSEEFTATTFYCLDAQTGNVIWSTNVPFMNPNDG